MSSVCECGNIIPFGHGECMHCSGEIMGGPLFDLKLDDEDEVEIAVRYVLERHAAGHDQWWAKDTESFVRLSLLRGRESGDWNGEIPSVMRYLKDIDDANMMKDIKDYHDEHGTQVISPVIFMESPDRVRGDIPVHQFHSYIVRGAEYLKENAISNEHAKELTENLIELLKRQPDFDEDFHMLLILREILKRTAESREFRYGQGLNEFLETLPEHICDLVLSV